MRACARHGIQSSIYIIYLVSPNRDDLKQKRDFLIDYYLFNSIKGTRELIVRSAIARPALMLLTFDEVLALQPFRLVVGTRIVR